MVDIWCCSGLYSWSIAECFEQHRQETRIISLLQKEWKIMVLRRQIMVQHQVQLEILSYFIIMLGLSLVNALNLLYPGITSQKCYIYTLTHSLMQISQPWLKFSSSAFCFPQLSFWRCLNISVFHLGLQMWDMEWFFLIFAAGSMSAERD